MRASGFTYPPPSHFSIATATEDASGDANATSVCHAPGRLAARGGGLHSPDDAQTGPREADVGRRAVALVGHRAAGLPRSGSSGPVQLRDRFARSERPRGRRGRWQTLAALHR